MAKLKIGKFEIAYEYVLVGIFLVVIIAIASNSFTSKNKLTAVTDTENYVAKLESKLEKSISKLNGVKNVTVAIQVEKGITTVIAEDVKKIEDNEKITITSTPILVGGKPIILGEIYPEITGIVVVCKCSGGYSVNMDILDVVTTMLDVSCDKVRILTQ